MKSLLSLSMCCLCFAIFSLPPQSTARTAEKVGTAAASASLQSEEKTTVRSKSAADQLLGEHKLSLQWISWEEFGSAKVVNDNGVYRISGRQEKDSELLTISGVIIEIDENHFIMDGTITTKISYLNSGQSCERQGRLRFHVRAGNSRSWRLSSMKNLCSGLTDYIDIYFTYNDDKPVDKTTSMKGTDADAAKLANIIADAVLQSNLMSRDSGAEVTAEFINDCVKERLATYIEFFCDDLHFPFFAKFFKGQASDYIYLVEEGFSVENRAFFRINGETVIKKADPISALITHEQVARWLNRKFLTEKYTAKKLEQIAHSHYRTLLPKVDGEPVTILSGELANPEHAYKPIGQIRWNGHQFELVDP